MHRWEASFALLRAAQGLRFWLALTLVIVTAIAAQAMICRDRLEKQYISLSLDLHESISRYVGTCDWHLAASPKETYRSSRTS
jgi:hypothetical protein